MVALGNLEFAVTTASNWSPSDPFLDRLCDAYERTAKCFAQTEGMWSVVEQKSAALSTRDMESLRNLLTSPAENDLYYGMDSLARFSIPLFAESAISGALLSILWC